MWLIRLWTLSNTHSIQLIWYPLSTTSALIWRSSSGVAIFFLSNKVDYLLEAKDTEICVVYDQWTSCVKIGGNDVVSFLPLTFFTFGHKLINHSLYCCFHWVSFNSPSDQKHGVSHFFTINQVCVLYNKSSVTDRTILQGSSIRPSHRQCALYTNYYYLLMCVTLYSAIFTVTVTVR